MPQYNSKDIRVLKGLEGVRMRPAMYIGGTDRQSLYHLIWEILDNSIDEFLAGHADRVTIEIQDNHWVRISDNGRGIPVDPHPTEKISAATVALTVLHAGGKFGGEGSPYKIAGGLHGVGASVVNALSKQLDLHIYRDGYEYSQEFRAGIPVAPLKKVGKSPQNGRHHGTTIAFSPDPKIFEDAILGTEAYQAVLDRVKIITYLFPGLSIEIRGPQGERETFHTKDFAGILQPITPEDIGDDICAPISTEQTVSVEDHEIQVAVAMQWHNGDGHVWMGFANGVQTPDGGTHETGFRAALLRSINTFALGKGIIKEPLLAADVSDGLVAAVSVRLHSPSFEGQTKQRLLNREANRATSTVVMDMLGHFFESRPREATTIAKRCALVAAARLASKAARARVLPKTASGGTGTLPGKLTDCSTKNVEEREIFIVEGDSAGGSAKMARNPKNQAILPLRGKVLNVAKADIGKVMKNDQIDNIIRALGCGIGKSYDISKIRYGKIIIMADADVDGSHITVLLATLFHTYLREIIAKGMLYVAMPPLYRVRKGKESHYIANEGALESFFKKHQDRDRWIVQRFKGLGEMDEDELRETTMQPSSRRLAQLTYAKAQDRSEDVFRICMGSDAVPRKALLEQKAVFARIDI